jgi:NADH-quinone oxidoreductase subunit J
MFEMMQFNFPQVIYGIFCFLAIFFAVGVVAFKNPVSSAFSLISVLISVAAIFAMQEAHFVAAVQILVYAGAIMVLFVFVIMLLNIEYVALDFPNSKTLIGASVLMGILFFALIFVSLTQGGGSSVQGPFTVEAIQGHGGNIKVVSEVMFSDYVLPFELMGVLLLLAVVGAIVLAKRKVE